MLGYARNRDAMAIPLNIPQLLESWMNTYRDQGEFQPAGLEGSYSVILFDSQKSYLAVYRSLIGHTSIYFHARPNGMLVGTNLGDLIDALPVKPKLNEIALPVYFLFRQVPGNLTLFDGVQRLLPGQLLSINPGEFSVRQLETFESLYSAQPISSGDILEQFESTMSDICQDYAYLDPQAAGLLSGGVDSTLIQVHWNRVYRKNTNGGVPKSIAVWLDHPQTRADRDYTQTAVDALQTDHEYVRVLPPSLKIFAR